MKSLQQAALQRPVSVLQRRSQELVRFAGRPSSRQQPDRQAAWRVIDEKYLNSSMQRRHILMCKMNGMTMRPNQDPDEYLTEVFQQRDELEHIGESYTRRASCISFWKA